MDRYVRPYYGGRYGKHVGVKVHHASVLRSRASVAQQQFPNNAVLLLPVGCQSMLTGVRAVGVAALSDFTSLLQW